jgi:hypothetical protein
MSNRYQYHAFELPSLPNQGESSIFFNKLSSLGHSGIATGNGLRPEIWHKINKGEGELEMLIIKMAETS